MVVWVRTDGTTSLLLQLVRVSLLGRLDQPESVDAVFVDRPVDLLQRPDDPRLPAQAVDSVCTWMHPGAITVMLYRRLLVMLALDGSHALDVCMQHNNRRHGCASSGSS